MTAQAVRRTGGRPTAQAAAALETTILEHATAAFLAEGYAVTTIEAIARTCSVAKRTIYARWNGKPDLFRAVLEGLIARWMSSSGDWADRATLEATLRAVADDVLAVALTPEAIALHRLIVAETARFPELPRILHQSGAGEGSSRIAVLLNRAIARGDLPPQDTAFAAEQFLNLLLTGPQRRCLGLGPALDNDQLRLWRDNVISIFLSGVHNLRLRRSAE